MPHERRLSREHRSRVVVASLELDWDLYSSNARRGESELDGEKAGTG